MSDLKPIAADPETKAAVAAYAAERGISQTKALAERKPSPYEQRIARKAARPRGPIPVGYDDMGNEIWDEGPVYDPDKEEG